MNSFVKKHYLIALRSGDYTQGKFYLCQDVDGKKVYCAAGILVDLYIQLKHKSWTKGETYKTLHNYEFMENGFMPAPCIRKWAGLSMKTIRELNAMNDFGNKSFQEIADYVEVSL